MEEKYSQDGCVSLSISNAHSSRCKCDYESTRQFLWTLFFSIVILVYPRIMYAQSTQANCWSFASLEKLQTIRKATHSSYVMEHRANVGFAFKNTRVGNFHPFLTAAEDRVVVQEHELVLLDIYRRFNPPMPHRVIGTACHYYKRFYLHNTAMEFPPKDILVACLYLAAREELLEFPLGNIKCNFEDGEGAMAAAIVNAPIVRAKLHHQLRVYNSFEPATDLLHDLKMNETMLKPEALWPYMKQFLIKAFLTDACLVYTPLHIAIASLLNAAAMLGEIMDGYLLHVLFRSKPHEFLPALTSAHAIRRMVNGHKSQQTPMVAAIECKLVNYWNNKSNTDYIAYCRSLRRVSKYLELRETAMLMKGAVLSYGVPVLHTKSPN